MFEYITIITNTIENALMIFICLSHIKGLKTLDTHVSCYLLKAYPAAYQTLVEEREVVAYWEECRIYIDCLHVLIRRNV